MKTLKINDIEIGKGMPKICVPITARTQGAAVKQAERAMRSPADIIEWRADYYQEIFNKNAIKNVLKLLRKHLPGKSILFTYRTAAEGGEGMTESDKYGALCRKAIDSGYIDIIDIEYSMGWHTVRHITTYAKQRGVAVISSSHDFEKTPLEDELRNRLSEMRKSGADIVKIAVMPRIPQEVLRIQSVAVEFSDSDNAVPVVAISMGKMGMASRITGEFFSSAISFASVGNKSAPGQPEADSLDRILIDIHRNLTDDFYDISECRFKQDENIVFIGFMGTGKTSVSRILSKICGKSLIDIDEAVEESENMKVSEIFVSKGEEYFRKIENEQVKKASSMKNIIIACGGGTVMRRENIEALKTNGKIVWLRANPDTIYSRVRHSRGKRPLLAKYMSRGYISWLLKKREDVYMEAADIVINMDGYESAEIAKQLMKMLPGFKSKK